MEGGLVDGVWIAGLLLSCVVGVILAVIRMPGTWLIVAAASAFSWHSGWQHPSWPILLALAGMAVVAEIIELVASLLTAHKAGASRRAMLFSMIGGFLGMFLLTVPLPVIGTIIGGALGCFIGAAVGQVTSDDADVETDLGRGIRVGLFAAIGQVLGNVAKVMVAVTMVGTVLAVLLFAGD